MWWKAKEGVDAVVAMRDTFAAEVEMYMADCKDVNANHWKVECITAIHCIERDAEWYTIVYPRGTTCGGRQRYTKCWLAEC